MVIYNHQNKNIYSQGEKFMENILRKQKFGVEIEFTGITREMAAKAVHQIVGGKI